MEVLPRTQAASTHGAEAVATAEAGEAKRRREKKKKQLLETVFMTSSSPAPPDLAHGI
jgi:hypothetical protein